MKKLLFSLLTIFALQPMLAMDGEGKRRKIDACVDQEEQETQEEQKIITPCPPAIPFAPELVEITEANLFKAIRDCNPDHCLWLIDQGVNVNSIGSFGRTPLIWAAQHNNHKLVAELLIRGADIHANNDEALWHAVMNDYAQTANTLLNHGANINARDANGHSFLSKAISRGSVKECRQFLKYGANPNDVDNHGVPVIIQCVDHIPLSDGHYECLKALLKYSANINAENPEDTYTPLMVAAYLGQLRTCELLLQWGAHPLDENSGGDTALDAVQYGIERFQDVDDDDGDYDEIINMFTDPTQIKDLLIRENNPCLERAFGNYSNISNAIQKRELGWK